MRIAAWLMMLLVLAGCTGPSAGLWPNPRVQHDVAAIRSGIALARGG